MTNFAVDALESQVDALNRENERLKAALNRFLELDIHDSELADNLWCIQQEEAPHDTNLHEHDAHVIEQQQIIDELKMECATQERGRKPLEEKGNHLVCEVRKLQQEVQSLRDMTHTLKEDNASLFNKLMQTHYAPQCEVMRSAFIAGVLCGNPQAEGRETVSEAADDYVCNQLVAKLKLDFDDSGSKKQVCTTDSHSTRRRDGASTMSDSMVFKLMNNHPNPVTRSVYRDMWIKRQTNFGTDD